MSTICCIDHLTCLPFDTSTIWHANHLTRLPFDTSTIWHADHLTHWPFDILTIWKLIKSLLTIWLPTKERWYYWILFCEAVAPQVVLKFYNVGPRRAAGLSEFSRANVVKVNPSLAQMQLRSEPNIFWRRVLLFCWFAPCDASNLIFSLIHSNRFQIMNSQVADTTELAFLCARSKLAMLSFWFDLITGPLWILELNR
jgi:hypothetical protein